MGVCYIVGAGVFSGMPKPKREDIVIAADGGYDSLISHGITPNLLIGDCDSVNEVPKGVRLLRFPVEKDDTDSFLAYREGRRLGFDRFEIYGGTGGREDHTLANLSLLLFAAREGAVARLHGERNVSCVIYNDSLTLSLTRDKHISVFAFGGEARGVTISGAYYEAKDITLTPEFPLGASNLSTGRDVTVSVCEGALLIMTEI